MNRNEILDRTILLFEYGSRAYGIDTEFSDHDLMGIMVEPREYVLGLRKFEQYQSNSGERSTASDTDETIYGLRKWAGLAAKGNPTVQTALFASSYEVKTEAGQLLLDNRDAFLSKEAGRRYLGYMQSQRMALLGEKNKRTNRPELVDTYGWDVKYGMHMIRLGYMGIELMRSGQISLPMIPEEREMCIAIRSGSVSLSEGLALSYELEEKLLKAISKSSLPEKTNLDVVSALLSSIYLSEWSSK